MSAAQEHSLPKDPNIAIHEVMNSIETIRDVYVRETDALEASDTDTFLGLQDEKLRAARTYQIGIEEFLQRKHEMQSVNPALKSQLEDMQKEFAALVTKNLEALDRMKRTMENIGSRVRNAAKEAAQRERATSYSETGQLHGSGTKSVSMGISETA